MHPLALVASIHTPSQGCTTPMTWWAQCGWYRGPTAQMPPCLIYRVPTEGFGSRLHWRRKTRQVGVEGPKTSSYPPANHCRNQCTLSIAASSVRALSDVNPDPVSLHLTREVMRSNFTWVSLLSARTWLRLISCVSGLRPVTSGDTAIRSWILKNSRFPQRTLKPDGTRNRCPAGSER